MTSQDVSFALRTFSRYRTGWRRLCALHQQHNKRQTKTALVAIGRQLMQHNVQLLNRQTMPDRHLAHSPRRTKAVENKGRNPAFLFTHSPLKFHRQFRRRDLCRAMTAGGRGVNHSVNRLIRILPC